MFTSSVRPRNVPIPGCTVDWDQYIDEDSRMKMKTIRRSLRGCPDWEESAYELMEQFAQAVAIQHNSNPRYVEIQCRFQGGIMDVSAYDFIPSNKLQGGVPVAEALQRVKPGQRENMLYRRWKQLHAPLVKLISAAEDARRAENAVFVAPKAQNHRTRKQAAHNTPPAMRSGDEFDASGVAPVSAEQQAKIDAEHARLTALNEAESEQQRAVRTKIDEEKLAQTEKPYSKAGPSGPVPPTQWVDESLSKGQKAKRKGQKAVSLEKGVEHEQALENKEQLRISQLLEQKEARRKAFEIGGSW